MVVTNSGYEHQICFEVGERERADFREQTHQVYMYIRVYVYLYGIQAYLYGIYVYLHGISVYLYGIYVYLYSIYVYLYGIYVYQTPDTAGQKFTLFRFFASQSL